MPENTLRPDASAWYSTASAEADIVEERLPPSQEGVNQNPLPSPTPPQYLGKQMARFYSEKPVFFQNEGKTKKTDTSIFEATTPNNTAVTENATVYQNPTIQQIMNQIFNQNSFFENQTPKQPQKDAVMQNILRPNQEKDVQGQKKDKNTDLSRDNREGGPLNSLKPQSELLKQKTSPILSPLSPKSEYLKPTNTPIRLQPTVATQAGQAVKKAPPLPPKLVIGRISVEVLQPPIAPLVRTIVQTEQRGDGGSTPANTSYHKLSFGLGQL